MASRTRSRNQAASRGDTLFIATAIAWMSPLGVLSEALPALITNLLKAEKAALDGGLSSPPQAAIETLAETPAENTKDVPAQIGQGHKAA